MGKDKPITKHIAYLGGDENKQVTLERSWGNEWELETQSRRTYEDFKGLKKFKFVGKRTRLLNFNWLSGRLFVRINHEAAHSRGMKDWERGVITSLIETEDLQLFIQSVFGFEIFNLFWNKIVDATRIKPEDYDWIEKMRQGGPFIPLKAQADEALNKLKAAIHVQNYLKHEYPDFANCLDQCIKDARYNLRRILTLENVHIYTLPEDLPDKILNADRDVCKRKMVKIAKEYKVWYEVKKKK